MAERSTEQRPVACGQTACTTSIASIVIVSLVFIDLPYT